MSKADIELVRAAESAADSARKRADEEAASVIAEGKKKARDLIDQSRKDADNLYKSAMSAAEEEAGKLYQEIIDREQQVCESIREVGRAGIEGAADEIVRKVVGIDGNS